MLWRGKDLLIQAASDAARNSVLSSGYPELDQHLYGGGWPQQGLVELLLPQAGIGELRLILPTLQQLTQNAYVVWVNPPFVPYATALKACGVSTNNLLIVQTRTHEETLWSVERCCLSSGCAGVVAWPVLNRSTPRRIYIHEPVPATIKDVERIVPASRPIVMINPLPRTPGVVAWHILVAVIVLR